MCLHTLARSSYDGVISEDHWDIGRAFPYGLCRADGGHIYNLPRVTDVEGWERGEIVTLDLREAQMATSSAPAPASERGIASAVPGWQKERSGWVVDRVIHRSPPAKQVHGRSMMYDGLQHRTLLSIRLRYTDAEPVCDEACVSAGNLAVKWAIERSSYGRSTLIETRVITVGMNGAVAPLVGCGYNAQVAPATNAALAAAGAQGIDVESERPLHALYMTLTLETVID